MTFYAHSANDLQQWHRLNEHLQSVGGFTSEFLGSCTYSEEGRLAGSLHDIGKYGDLFQRRLHGQESGLDHWSQGAWLACVEHQSVGAALAIQGHHIGLQSLHNLHKAIPNRQSVGAYPDGLRLSESDLAILKQRFIADGLYSVTPARRITINRRLDAMLDIRRLFSALVDADFLDTEAHFEADAHGKRYRPLAPDLQAERALQVLEAHIAQLNGGAKEHPMQGLRTVLHDTCLEYAARPPGLYTLTAPTGSGKTLAMLAYSLKHAAQHQLRRVVMVIPYLTIIEQTASTYRRIFESPFGEHYVLEHHSLAGLGEEQAKTDAEGAPQQSGLFSAQRRRQQQTENWDAPLIVTTSVQMLESLFSNRPSACRKLHRLANSVILFDEVQTLPTQLAVPTLAALSHLVSDWGCTVVFATATQPAFDALAVRQEIRKHCKQGWQPAAFPAAAVAAPQRVRWDWRESSPMAVAEIANALAAAVGGQSMSIFNTKNLAREVFEALREYDASAFHLSTNLCPMHRTAVLSEVRERLSEQKPVHLVATQCVEAGVDVDFPEVWRAFAPLDALIQAAGRCNRNGLRSEGGRMVVFKPDGNRYPDRSYEQAASATEVLLKQYPHALATPEAPDIIRKYYELLYSLRDIAMPEDLARAINELDFAEMAQHYRLIRQDAINVLVLYEAASESYKSLLDVAGSQGISGSWMRKARGLTVSLFRPKPGDVAWDSLIPLQEKRRGQLITSEDWFTISKPEHYDRDLGLHLPKNLNLYIG